MSRTKRSTRNYAVPYRNPRFRRSLQLAITAAEELSEAGGVVTSRLQAQGNLGGSKVAHTNWDKTIACYREGRTLEQQLFLSGSVFYTCPVDCSLRQVYLHVMDKEDANSSVRILRIAAHRLLGVDDVVVDSHGDRYAVTGVDGFELTLKFVGRGR